MGRGNVRVTGPYEGLYYIDHDDLDFYRKCSSDYEEESVLLRDIPYEELNRYEYDELNSCLRRDEVFDALKASIMNRFPCFFECDEWIDRDRKAFLESKLFYICCEDNKWSIAIELIQKEPVYGDGAFEGLQKHHYQRFLAGIREALFEEFDTLGTYAGPWTSGTIHKENLENGGMKVAV